MFAAYIFPALHLFHFLLLVALLMRINANCKWLLHVYNQEGRGLLGNHQLFFVCYTACDVQNLYVHPPTVRMCSHFIKLTF